MPDVFLEERVVRTLSRSDRIARAAIIAVASAVVLAGLLLLPGLTLVSLGVIVAAVWGARHLLKRLNREYEYTFTNGELDVDVIYNKEWRKRLCTLDFRRDVTVMAKVGSPELAAAGRQVRVWIDAGRGAPDEEVWGIVYRRGGEAVAGLYWNPSADMIRACRDSAPRVVLIDAP